MTFDERQFMIQLFEHAQESRLSQVEAWVQDTLNIASTDIDYRTYRQNTYLGLEVGSLVAGGYGLVKGAINFTKLARVPRYAKKSIRIFTSGAENINAGISLTKKLSHLENAQRNFYRMRILGDGRIRFYKNEIPATTPGLTRGACRVCEYNPLTGQSRAWHECYDHFGNVIRVHPKQINGQDLISPHYPPIEKEISW
jgi:filamentous hemagglutinin